MDRLSEIRRFIDIKNYTKALTIIKKEARKTLHSRTLKNLLAKCYMGLGDYDEAQRILSDSCPYEQFDQEDIITLELLSDIAKANKRTIKSKLFEISKELFSADFNKSKQITSDTEMEYDVFFKTWISLNQDDNAEMVINKIIEECLILLRIPEACVFILVADKLGIQVSEDARCLLNEFLNTENFTRDLSQKNYLTAVVICSNAIESKVQRKMGLAKALSLLGYNVELLTDESNKVSCRNMKVEFYDGTPSEANEVLDSVYSNLNKCPFLLFTDMDFAYELNEIPNAYKRIEMYFRHYENQPSGQSVCLLYGEYLKAISIIWNENIEELVHYHPDVDFSIIIPAKNSAKYLEASVKTCLNQDYSGSFEVLVSDNSDLGNNQVSEMFKDYSDSRLRYVRVPFPLSLPKSFEYAYLHARGRYLLSLGSDDGLMPNALSTIKKAFENHPDSRIVHFDGVFYTWPNPYRPNGELSSSHLEFSGGRNCIQINPNEYIERFLNGGIPFSQMPILYMVTCTRREQIQRIIDITGKFEYGDSQDVYTGLLNMMIEDKITYINSRILIGGSSNAGVGQQFADAVSNNKEMAYIRKCYSNYRFMNLYNSDVRDNEYYLLWTENEWFFLVREYRKCLSLGLNTSRKLTDEKLIQLFHKAYLDYPIESHDINILLSQINKMVRKASNTVQVAYSACSSDWMWEREKKIKKERLKLLSKRILRTVGIIELLRNITIPIRKKRGENTILADGLFKYSLDKEYLEDWNKRPILDVYKASLIAEEINKKEKYENEF